MSTSNVPIKGNAEWLKSLTPGTPLYNAEYFSETNEVVIHKMIFDSYDSNAVKKDGSEAVYAKVHVEGASDKIKVPTQDISYGYFQSPLEALESFQAMLEHILKAAEKAVTKEEKRLSKQIKELTK